MHDRSRSLNVDDDDVVGMKDAARVFLEELFVVTNARHGPVRRAQSICSQFSLCHVRNVGTVFKFIAEIRNDRVKRLREGFLIFRQSLQKIRKSHSENLLNI